MNFGVIIREFSSIYRFTAAWFLQHPVYCLKITVKEAKGILGKDISGMSSCVHNNVYKISDMLHLATYHWWWYGDIFMVT